MQARDLISWFTNYGPAFAVVSSFLALLVSVFSLGWNVYRDVILKPRLRVRFDASQLVGPDGNVGKPFLSLSIVNLGPGNVICEMPIVKNKPFYRGFLGEATIATIIHDFTNPLCAKPPFKVAVGERTQLTFPIADKCFLDDALFRIGIRDSFGRIHWAPKKQIRQARQRLKGFRRNSV
jgi:hypothetical protein